MQLTNKLLETNLLKKIRHICTKKLGLPFQLTLQIDHALALLLRTDFWFIYCKTPDRAHGSGDYFLARLLISRRI
jgi:hypothetical protein